MYRAILNNSIIIELYNDMFRISQTQNLRPIEEMGLYNSIMAIFCLPLA